MNRRRGRIVFTSYFGDLGGGELRLLDHLRLTRLPRERLTLIQFNGGPLAERAQQLGVGSEVIPWAHDWPLPLKALRAPLLVARLVRALRGASLLVCNTYLDLIIAGPIAWALRVPIVWRSRAEVFPFLGQRRRWRSWLLLHFLRRAVARILTTTAYDRQLMLDHGLPSDTVHLVRQGVDHATYLEAQSRRERLREELGFGPETPVIGFVARIVPQKGHLIFLDALARVKREVPDVRALMAGDTTLNQDDPERLKPTIHTRVRELGLSHAVVFTGFRDDIPAVMAAIDVLAHASLREPFGTVLVEAMAAGRPVVASATLGPMEIVQDGVDGVLVEPGNAELMARALVALLADPALRERMGKSALERATREFDLATCVRRLDEHCVSTLRRPSRGARQDDR